MRFYKLTDSLNYGEVVKDENGKSFTYCFGPDKWVRSAVMSKYEWPHDNRFNQYTEINQEEAEELLAIQKKKLTQLLQEAKRIATTAHEGQLDIGGVPYIKHPQTVAASLESIEQQIVAWLHDVIEDTSVTADDLIAAGFTKRIVNSVQLLTKEQNTDYDEYIKAIKCDDNAWCVKIADLKHNMDLNRISSPSANDYARIEKYKKALNFLES